MVAADLVSQYELQNLVLMLRDLGNISLIIAEDMNETSSLRTLYISVHTFTP